MKTTYNDILNAMKNAFYDNCGESVDLYSDIGARFQAVASELYSLACYEDYVLKQAFPQTATGKYLDYHAQLRNKTRKSPTKAHGFLTFYINEPFENDIEIPAGTICSVKNEPYIQFETTQNGIISAGECFVDVEATALGFGDKYNVSTGTVTVMVNPPLRIDRVSNNGAFIGGVDEESDEKLRRRILTSYSVPQNGVNLKSISQSIENIDGVLDCVIYYENDSCMAYVKTADNTMDMELYNKVINTFTMFLLQNKEVNAQPAQPKQIDLKVSCKSHISGQDLIKDKIEKLLVECFDGVSIGEALNSDKLIMKIAKIDDVEDVEINSSTMRGGVIPANNNEYLKLGEIEVFIYD